MTTQQQYPPASTIIVSGWYRLSWWQQCILIWLAVAVALSISGLIGVRIAQAVDDYNPPGIVIPGDGIAGMWNHWDADWYLAIVNEGYPSRPDAMGFFPLYPFITSNVSSILGIESYVASVIVSHLSYLVAILFFYRLARLVRDEHDFAIRSVGYMVLFPTSFFFLAGYAESLYLALAIMSFYFTLRRFRGFILGGLAAGLAAAARPTGWLLGVIFLSEFVQQRDFSVRAVLRLFLAGLLTVSGIIVYVIYLYTLTGSFTAIVDTQATGWNLTWQWPWQTVWDAVILIPDFRLLQENWFLYALNIFDLAFAIFAIVMTILAVRLSLQKKLDWTFSVFVIASLIFLFSRRGFQVPLDEMARWTATLFPFFLVMAIGTYKRSRLQWAVMLLSGTMLVALTAWWATGRWVG